MKKSIYKIASENKSKILMIVFGMVLSFTAVSQSQVSSKETSSSVPSWCKAIDADAHYYYIPDVQAYYDVHTSMFIYQVKNVWVHKANLPEKYSSYDLSCGYKVMITGNINFDTHKTKYAKVNYAKANYAAETKVIAKKPVKATKTSADDKFASLVF